MTALGDANLRRYYDQRALEYEQIYRPRDAQHGHELGELSRERREVLRGRRVLEITCGTGYWTACAAHVALRVTATDASTAMLDEARRKPLPPNVKLLARNAYDLGGIEGTEELLPPGRAAGAVWPRHLGPGRPARRMVLVGDLPRRPCALGQGGGASSAGTERCGSPPRTSTLPPSRRQTSISLRMPKRLAR